MAASSRAARNPKPVVGRPRRKPRQSDAKTAVGAAEDAAVEQMVETLVEPVEAVSSIASAKDADPIKHKLVRDSFTMPKNEYQAIDALKKRLLQHSLAIKKGELLRAGVACLVRMSDEELILAVSGIPSLKTGRPKRSKDQVNAA